MKNHILAVLVENRAGTLSRVSHLFSRRGFNIDSLTVGETENPAVSRMTITVTGDDAVLEQITKQLGKLIDVIAIEELETGSSNCREIMLIKVRAEEADRAAVLQIVSIFRCRVIDISQNTITIEATGAVEKLNGLLQLVRPYGILETARTGITALSRGARTLSPDSLPAGDTNSGSCNMNEKQDAVVNRNQIEHRAAWLALIYDELQKSGVNAEPVLRRAVRRCGQIHGERLKEQCKDAADFDEFKNSFLTPLSKETFSVNVVKNEKDSLEFEFNCCALVESWKKLGVDEDTRRILCDIAMEGDRGIAETFGLKFELGDVIAAGCKTCRLRFSKV